MFAVHFPSVDALATIFSSILSAHFLQGGFSYGVSRSVGTLIQVHSVQHLSTVQSDFSLSLYCTNINLSIYQCFILPPSSLFHYLSNLLYICLIYCSTYLGSYLSASKNQPELPPHGNTLSLHLQPARSL